VLAIKFSPRQKTEYIFVKRKKNSPDVGVNQINTWARREGYIALPWHFVVRRDGTIEDGRDVNSLIVPFHTSVRILVLCERDTWTPEQEASVTDLIDNALKRDFPEAEVRAV
jgi:hypothetical protein